jgi:hypothetical protein
MDAVILDGKQTLENHMPKQIHRVWGGGDRTGMDISARGSHSRWTFLPVRREIFLSLLSTKSKEILRIFLKKYESTASWA